jgi:predicted enzyme related to lactoylglutathione lyase
VGNDLIGLHVRVDGAAQRARDMGLEVLATEEEGVVRVQSPDGQWLFLHPPAAEEDQAKKADPFLYVSLHTSDLERSRNFYRNVLGMNEFASSSSAAASSASASASVAAAPSAAPSGRADVRAGAAWSLLGFSALETKLELVELPPGSGPVNHAAAFGRIAFAGSEVQRTYERAVAAGGESSVLHPPVTLDTPGKARVQVTILADPDGYEICVVDSQDFAALSVTKPGDEVVKWEWRDKAIAKQMKFQKAFEGGGDDTAAAAADSAKM